MNLTLKQALSYFWQKIVLTFAKNTDLEEKLEVDITDAEEGSANLINADSLGGVLASDYALKSDLGNTSIEVDATLSVEGMAADAAAVGNHINNQENPHNVTAEQVGAAPSSHTHSQLTGWADTRTAATTPNDYNELLKVVGIKNSTATGTVDGSTYCTIMGIRGWGDSSGGDSHELAFTGNGNLYHRHGATTDWENWEQIYTSTMTTAIPISQGGTGATNAADARLALGITADWVKSCLSNANGVSF